MGKVVNNQTSGDISFHTDPGAATHSSWGTQNSEHLNCVSTPNASWQTEGADDAAWGFEDDAPPGMASVAGKQSAPDVVEVNQRLTEENEQLRQECLARENEMLRKRCEQANAEREVAEAQAKVAETMAAAAMTMQGYAVMGPNGVPMPMTGMPMMYPMMPGMMLDAQMQRSPFMMPGMMMPGMIPGQAFGQMPALVPEVNRGAARKTARPKAAEKADIEDPPFVPDGGPATTLMLRNLPNDYGRDMMLSLLDAQGFAGAYDFFYLPVDFKSNAGLGYAFVNLVSADQVKPFWDAFSGFSDWSMPSQKVCSVSWSNPHQGLASHIERFKNSFLMHEDVPDEHRPVLFQGGIRVAFPPPTRQLHPPHPRQIGR